MFDLLDILVGVTDVLGEIFGVLRGWRFFLCIAAGILAIALIYGSLESDKVALALAIPTGAVFFTTGLIWDIRNG